jgi:Tfp pilus assembly protein PilN
MGDYDMLVVNSNRFIYTLILSFVIACVIILLCVENITLQFKYVQANGRCTLLEQENETLKQQLAKKEQGQ